MKPMYIGALLILTLGLLLVPEGRALSQGIEIPQIDPLQDTATFGQAPLEEGQDIRKDIQSSEQTNPLAKDGASGQLPPSDEKAAKKDVPEDPQNQPSRQDVPLSGQEIQSPSASDAKQLPPREAPQTDLEPEGMLLETESTLQKEAPKPPPQPSEVVTYSVWDCRWDLITDVDADGYRRSARLMTDVDVNDGSYRTIYLKIWRKLATSTTWTLVYTTGNYTIHGTGIEWIYYTVTNLDHNVYDYWVQVYDANNTYQTYRGPDQDADLDNELFEYAWQDVTVQYTVWDCAWDLQTDIDGDGYRRYARLRTDVDVNDGSSRYIYLKIYRKLATSATYTPYFTTPNYLITGTAIEWIYVWVGSPNTQLDHNVYDFLVEVYEAGGTLLKASRSPTQDADLDNELFEYTTQDVTVQYTVWDCAWDLPTDIDGDGYRRYARLRTDVDVNDGSSRYIYLKIYRKLATSATYTPYFNTPNYLITGYGIEWIYVWVGLPNTQLDHNIYDFLVEVYEAGGTLLKASRSPTQDLDLNDQKFETVPQDPPPTLYSVYNCWWTNPIDQDADRYTSYRRLTTDVDVNDGSTRYVYMKIYRKTASSSVYTLHTTTPVFRIIGIQVEPIWVAVTGLNEDWYDFKVDVFESGGTLLKATRGPTDDTDLNDQTFESTVDDLNILRNPSFEFAWTSGTMWGLVSNGSASYSIVSGGCSGVKRARIQITTPGTDVRFGQSNVGPLQPNTRYRAEFCGYSNTGHDVRVLLFKQASPYTSYGLDWVVNLTTTSQTFWREFTTTGFTGTVWDGRFRFRLDQFDASGDVFYFDNVKLRKIGLEAIPAVAGGSEAGTELPVIPQEYALLQNYPNPFNPMTTVQYALPEPSYVRIEVFDVLGRTVEVLMDGEMQAGVHAAEWNATGVASGVYYYRMNAHAASGKTYSRMQTMMLVK